MEINTSLLGVLAISNQAPKVYEMHGHKTQHLIKRVK